MADFWTDIGNKCCSEKIKKLLSDKSCTLEEVISDDEFLQEVTTKNEELVNFLSREDIFMQILVFMTEIPDELDNDYKRCYKYPFIACELFGCNNQEVTKIFYSNIDKTTSKNKYLDKLFSIIYQEGEIESLISGYFLRTVTILIQNTTADFLEYFFSEENIVDSMIKNHLQEFSIVCL